MKEVMEIVQRVGMRVVAVSAAITTMVFVFTGSTIDSALIESVISAILLIIGLFPNSVKKLN